MKNKDLIKISFTGDLICELPYFQAVRRKNKYNFDETFKYLKAYFKDSDYVVGNLETPISSPCFGGYTNDEYCFNTPKTFLKAIKESNFDLLMTANNHCLDRGIFGLKQTIKNIKKYDMDYIGTKQKRDESDYKVIDIDGIKIAFLAYTYGTNYSYNFYKLNKKNKFRVNLIKKQDSDKTWEFNKLNFYKDTYRRWFIRDLKRIVKEFTHYESKRSKKNYEEAKKIDVLVVDEKGKGEWNIDKKLLNESIKQTKEAIKNSDITVFMLHSGGQFNKEPGSFTRDILKEIKKTSVDLIVSNHPHVVQKMEKRNNKLITYSLGNLINSYKVWYYRKKHMGEYSVILNTYINRKTKQIEKYTFSIMKSIESKDGYITVYPVYDLINNETNNNEKSKLIKESLIIYNRFLNKKETYVKNQKEYEI